MSELTELEQDGMRYREMLRIFDRITVEIAGMAITTVPAPQRKLLFDAWIAGAIAADVGTIDQ